MSRTGEGSPIICLMDGEPGWDRTDQLIQSRQKHFLINRLRTHANLSRRKSSIRLEGAAITKPIGLPEVARKPSALAACRLAVVTQPAKPIAAPNTKRTLRSPSTPTSPGAQAGAIAPPNGGSSMRSSPRSAARPTRATSRLTGGRGNTGRCSIRGRGVPGPYARGLPNRMLPSVGSASGQRACPHTD